MSVHNMFPWKALLVPDCCRGVCISVHKLDISCALQRSVKYRNRFNTMLYPSIKKLLIIERSKARKSHKISLISDLEHNTNNFLMHWLLLLLFLIIIN